MKKHIRLHMVTACAFSLMLLSTLAAKDETKMVTQMFNVLPTVGERIEVTHAHLGMDEVPHGERDSWKRFFCRARCHLARRLFDQASALSG